MTETLLRALKQLPRAMLFSLVFFAIPLGLLLYGCHQWWEEKAQRLQQSPLQKLDSYLASWRGDRPYLVHLENVLKLSGLRALRRSSPRKSLPQFIRSMHQRFPGVLHFLFLDNQGQVITALSDMSPPAPLMKRFFSDYTAENLGFSQPLARSINQYRSFLGPMVGREKDIKLYNKFLSASQRVRHAHVYLSPVTTNGMFIAFVDRPPDLEEICLADMVQTQQTQNAPWIMELVNLKGKGLPSPRVWGYLGNQAQKALGHLESGANPFLAQEGFIWASVPHLEKFRLLLAIPDPSQEFLQVRRESLLLVAHLLLPTLFLLIWVAFSRPVPPTLSIKGKLTLLFLYVVGTPLLLMAISAHGFIRDRRAVLENQLHQRQEEFLNAFDRRYPEANGRFEMEVQRLLLPPLHASHPTQDLRERFAAIRRLYDPIMGEAIDAHGVARLQMETAWVGVTKRIIAGIQGAATNLLRDINQEPLQEKVSAKEQLLNMTAEFLGFNMEMIMAGFSQNLGSLKEFGVSRGTIQVMMSPLFNSRHKAEYLALLAWHKMTLESRYLETHLASFSVLLPHTHLLAVCGDYDKCLPHHSPYLDHARSLADHVENQEIPLKRILQGSSGDLFLCAMNGKHLKNFKLFAYTGSQGIDEEIARSLKGYAWLSLAILALSLLVGRALARQFFVPVGHLERGLQAVKERNFDHRIPVISSDEFGILSGTFNAMLEGLEELEVAKIVQETFFPQESLLLSGWEVFGKSVPASRVGGDYFDYFPIGDDRIGILIGDVSGHGVAAALVVAMAKALISHPGTDPDPQSVLQTIQTVMMKTLKRKKIMTCFFAVFQPSTGVLLASNAGHSFPFLIQNDRIEQIELPGSPLGTRLCKVQPPITRILDDHSLLLLYTDGFTEARDHKQEIIGTPRVEAALLQSRGGDARETIERLQAWHDVQTTGSRETGSRRTGSPQTRSGETETETTRAVPPEDDITLVVLQKRRHTPSSGASPEKG